ncbi:MAG: recombinase [Lachnospiraceae bacterium]|nr:recombinase [Lachnospiraceae bacterium]
MKMTLFGYTIKNGKAYIDKEKAVKVQKLFDGYISGLALRAAALEAGIDTFHGSAGRMLQNKKYMGTDFYPTIISEEIFQKAQVERENRAVKLGRVREVEEDLPILSPSKFRFKSNEIIFDDPFKQAEYAYSMIESEWF